MNNFNKQKIYSALVVVAIICKIVLSLYLTLTGKFELACGWISAMLWSIMYANKLSNE